MARNILVFQDLISKLPVLREELRRLGVGVLIVTGGKDALDKATKMGAEAVLLGVNMPQMGGTETFEAILIHCPKTRAFLVRRSPHEYVPDAFLESHAEGFSEIEAAQQKIGAVLIPMFGGDWNAYSKKDLRPPKDAVEQRLAQRFPTRGEATLEYDGETCAVHIQNLSRTGALFACDREIPLGAEAKAHFVLPNQETLAVSLQVVRVKPHESGTSSIGARFLELGEEELRKIDLWITALRFVAARAQEGEPVSSSEGGSSRSIEDLPPLGVGALDPKFVRSILNFRGPEVISLLSHRTDPRLRWIQALSSVEVAALESSDENSIKIQRSIALRAKCGVFFDFVPTMVAHQKTLGDPLLNIFIAMVQDIEAEEPVTGEAIERMAAEHPEVRKDLNAVVNQLHFIKSKAIAAVVHQLDRDRFGQHPAFLELEKRVQRGDGGFDEVRYQKKPEPKKDEKKQRTFSIKISKKIKVALAVASVVAFAGVLFRTTSGYVSVSKLELTFEITRAKRFDTSLELICLRNQWERLRMEDKEETMGKIEKFLTDEKMRQAKLFDENGKLLAATAVVQRPIGKPPVYTRRIQKLSSF